jgi:hypothetical protein
MIKQPCVKVYDSTGDGVYTVTKYDDDTGAGASSHIATISIPDTALVPITNTGAKHLTGTIDLRELGTETGRFSAVFNMQLPSFPCDAAGEGGFPILQVGNGGPGTLTVQVVPVSGGGPPNMVTASITGDALRRVTVRPRMVGILSQVFVEYNGSDLTLVVGDSADTYHATSILPLATSPAAFLFACDVQGLAFDNLQLFNTTLSALVYDSPTGFPYFLWDGTDCGVLAVMPVTYTPGEIKTFIDMGYHTGHQPAALDLSSSANLTNPKLYVNEQEVTLGFGNGQTAAAFVTSLTTNNGGIVSFPFDGKTENIKFVKTGTTTVTAVHTRAGVDGQMSFAIRMKGGTGGDWDKTVAIIGKIPQQFYLPHTGKLNEGISIMGADKQVTSPKALKLQRRDDKVRTVGRIIGSIANRPASKSMLETLEPIPWFGAQQAPIPKGSMVWGNASNLKSTQAEQDSYTYGLTWFKYMSIDPPDKTMAQYPNCRSHIGDHVMGFSLDIPYGKVLRGVDINFSAMPPGLIGNTGFGGTENAFDWGWGNLQFPMLLSGNADYTCIFTLMVATDPDGKRWRPIPSIGADAVKVSGANVWKSISFKTLDYQTLLDDQGNPLLVGSRRTHFKVVLSAELTAVAYAGLSYSIESAPKK